MIRNLRTHFYQAFNFKGSITEKGKVFFMLNRFYRRQRKKPKKNEIVRESILKYSVSAYDYWSLHYLFHEIFINKEYHFEPDRKNPIIFDCGANMGMATLYFKWIFPYSSIIAFEPNPNSYALLENNIRENNLENVQIFNLGLSNEEGEIPFYLDVYNPGTLIGSIKRKRGGAGEISIETIKLSNFMAQHDEIDLVKMDIEGAETEVVEDLVASGMIYRVKEFIIEYHHNISGEDSHMAAFLKLFEANGFNYNIKTSFSKLKGFQDVLIHFYKKY